MLLDSTQRMHIFPAIFCTSTLSEAQELSQSSPVAFDQQSVDMVDLTGDLISRRAVIL